MIKLTDREIQLAARLNCRQAALELIKNACEVEFFEMSDNFKLTSDSPTAVFEYFDKESKQALRDLSASYPELQEKITQIIINSPPLPSSISRKPDVGQKSFLALRLAAPHALKPNHSSRANAKPNKDTLAKLVDELIAIDCNLIEIGTYIVGKRFTARSAAEAHLRKHGCPVNANTLFIKPSNTRIVIFPSPLTQYPQDQQAVNLAIKDKLPKLTPEQALSVLEYLPGVPNSEEHLSFFKMRLQRGTIEVTPASTDSGDDAAIKETLKLIRGGLKPFVPTFYNKLHIYPGSTLLRREDGKWEIHSPESFAAMIPYTVARLSDAPPFLKDIIRARTNGINYGISPNQLIEKLTEWHEKWGPLRITDVSGDYFKVLFENPPQSDQYKLALEIIQLCPPLAPPQELTAQTERLIDKLKMKQPIDIGWD
ncbi:MAG: DUF4253 domain-containing protein [Candidatus Obscuribacter sp.]|nr:DUF4253 domain-containing protein [Candidatus Obscuribacter sp.]MBP6595471.1 DUF4253 domain-containing protein [Candidatus Obscuribacter sp.]MBP7577135.1 DUF4253 domain-containing protein [Candidatus Obscuribacter sp.]